MAVYAHTVNLPLLMVVKKEGRWYRNPMTNSTIFSELHDSNLLSIAVENGTQVTFVFELVDGSRNKISIANSVQLLCSDFLLGNIVFECGYRNSPQSIDKGILPVSEYVDVDQIVGQFKEDIAAGTTCILYVTSSYGANLYCVGDRPVLLCLGKG